MSHSRPFQREKQTALQASLVAVLLLAWPSQGLAAGEVEARLREIRETWFSIAESTKPFSTKCTKRLYRSEASKPLDLSSETVASRVMSSDGIAFDNRVYDYTAGERKLDRHEIHLINDRYSCVLIDKSDNNRFILSGQPTMHDQKRADAWDRDARLYGRLPWLAPSGSFKIPDLLDPEFTQVARIEELGDGLLRVSFRARPDIAADKKEKLRAVMAGALVLNRNKHYRLESAEIQLSQQSYTSYFRLTYESPPHEEYLLKGLEQKSNWTGQVPMHGKEDGEYECRHDIEVDPRQFYMSQYGLPEPLGVTPPKKPTPRYVWFLAGAAVLAALSLLLRWVAKRRSRTALTTPVPRPDK